MGSAHVAGVAALVATQQTRLFQQDGRMRPPRTIATITTVLEQQRQGTFPPLVACDAQGRVCGYVAPDLWKLPDDDGLLALFTRRNGIARWLTLPTDTIEADAVRAVLFEALRQFWDEHQTEGDIFSWPACDVAAFVPTLASHGFQTDSQLAYRLPGPLPPARRPPPAGVHVRPACPADADVTTALALEEMAFHERLTSFSRVVPTFAPQFQAKFARAMAGEAGAPLFLLAEHQGNVVGMAELTVEDYRERESHLPAVRYGCIYSFIVRADARGQGVGRMLVDASLALLHQQAVEAYYLYFVPSNPLSRRFWPAMGFVPLVTTYQRRSSTPVLSSPSQRPTA
jgi:GNAT superfamily N-acetyltransferase